jgi:hypothetical protein
MRMSKPFYLGAAIMVINAASPMLVCAQSADWQQVVWREPQVRYLLADLTLGGNPGLYRKYGTEEKDPDSREAIRRWDVGARVVNTNDFERRWITNGVYTTNRYLRVVLRGSNRTITGNEVLLTSDLGFDDTAMRLTLLSFALGKPVSEIEGGKGNPSTAEAIRRWKTGARVLNTNWFEARGDGVNRRLYFTGTDALAGGSQVRLNCDLAYPENNVRYFLADISLGGSADFYRRVAEEAHEMGCLEVVTRWDAGVRLTNLDQFERKQVKGKTLITRKGSDERISGMEAKLSTD